MKDIISEHMSSFHADEGSLLLTIGKRTVSVPYFSVAQRAASMQALTDLVTGHGYKSRDELRAIAHHDDRDQLARLKADIRENAKINVGGASVAKEANNYDAVVERFEAKSDPQDKRLADLRAKAAKRQAEIDERRATITFHAPGSATRGLFERSVENYVRAALSPSTLQSELDALYLAHTRLATKGDTRGYAAEYDRIADTQLSRITTQRQAAHGTLDSIRQQQDRIEAGRIGAKVETPPPGKVFRRLPNGEKEWGTMSSDAVPQFVPDDTLGEVVR